MFLIKSTEIILMACMYQIHEEYLDFFSLGSPFAIDRDKLVFSRLVHSFLLEMHFF